MATYSEEVLADSPSAYWKLGEASGVVAADEIDTYPGDYAGGVVLGEPGPLEETEETAALLDGTTGVVVMTDVGDLDFEDIYTLEAWIKRTDLLNTNYETILEKTVAYILSMYNGVLELWLTGDDSSVYSSVAIEDTEWHHIAVTQDTGNAFLYLDGEDVSFNQTEANTPSSPHPFSVGATLAGGVGVDGFFNGTVAQVAIYLTALTPERILAHYEASDVAIEVVPNFDPENCFPVELQDGTIILVTKQAAEYNTSPTGFTIWGEEDVAYVASSVDQTVVEIEVEE